MKIIEIHISAGRTFNHPTERYANLRFDIAATAQFPDGAGEADARILRIQLEQMAERHKADLLHDINAERLHKAAHDALEKAQEWKDRAETADEREKEPRYKSSNLPSGRILLPNNGRN